MERIEIWGDVIPGNSGALKETVMEIKYKKNPNVTIDTIRWLLALRGSKFRDNKRILDTFTATWVAKRDDAYRETFEDVPYLLPFVVKESRQAVIVVPGGGYCTKEMEGEGTLIAEELNRNGITAFVLWYRTNPYYQPYPLLDMQRAVRYVRFHAKEYGYDEDKISAIGFSGGGSQVAMFANILQGNEKLCPDYPKDEIDRTDDRLNRIALVYPLLSYCENVPLMFASFPAQDVRDEKRRMELMDIYDAVNHMKCTGIPHFICYGSKEDMVSVSKIEDYVEILQKSGTSLKRVIVEGAKHGYGAAMGKKEGYWLEEYIRWLKGEYAAL
ncbi:MAG: alpha/beta hydrolase [Lachnospiraceae bacterium]|nr:alpha/beta hydrolase [Lachnospiraceae bacterium]